MYNKLILLFGIIGLFLSGSVESQDRLTARDFKAEEMAHSIMQRNPGVYNDWDYVTGTVLRGFQELWQVTRDTVYFKYIQNTIDAVVREDGSIAGYSLSDYNIDEVKTGTTLMFLYRTTGQEKYRLAADLIRSQLDEHPRTSEGGFWHKQIYPHQMWLDGLYMGTPFYAEYSRVFDNYEDFDDVIDQFVFMENHARDSETGLLYHGWDESGEQSWADEETGASPSFWGRAVGWYGIALVDVLDFIPEDHSRRDELIAILQRLAPALADCQDETTGCWYQVLDQGGREGNYIESSATSMFVYTLAKGVRMGYIEKEYLEVAEKGYQGILDNFIDYNNDGTLDLTDNCLTAGLGNGRDGTYDYYVYETVKNQNDGKGLGPFLTASVEIEVLNRIIFPLNLQVDDVKTGLVELSWDDRSDNETGFLIERAEGESSENEFEEVGIVDADAAVFQDNSVLPDSKYTYRVRAFNEADTSKISNLVVTGTLGENGEPSAFTLLSPENGTSGVNPEVFLNWEESFTATSYSVYMDQNSNPETLITQTDNPGYQVDEPLESYTTYYWRVEAENENGKNEGAVWSFTTGGTHDVVAHWSLDEIDDDRLADGSGLENHGTAINFSGSGLGQGIINQGLFFNGEDQYVSVPHSTSLDFSDDSFTVMFWMKQMPENVDNEKEYRYIIKGSHTNDQSAGTSGKRYEVFFNPASSEIRFSIDDDNVKSRAVAHSDSFVTGEWVHVTAVRNTDDATLKLYANGNQVASGTDETGDISQEEELFLGYCVDFGSYFEGGLDEVKVLNYAMDESDIEAVYQSERGVSNEVNDLFEENTDIFIYPNPANSFVIVDLKQQRELVSGSVFNSFGKKIYSFSEKNVEEFEVDVNKFKEGLYILTIETGNIKQSFKFSVGFR